MENEVLRKDTIKVYNLGQGTLDPARTNTFITKVRNHSKFLQMIRVETKSQKENKIDKVMLGEPITEKADEHQLSTRFDSPVFGQIKYSTEKLRSQYSMTWESLRENLEKKSFSTTYMNMVRQKLADDYELLGIQGVEGTSGDTPQAKLLRCNNGFDYLTQENSNLLDVGGSTMSTSMFSEALKRMPVKYRKDPSKLRWFCSPNAKIDYIKMLQGRATPLGDLYTVQNMPVYANGILIEDIPYIPDDKPLTVSTATAAYLKSERQGPFNIEEGVNDNLVINVNSTGNVSVKLQPGGWSAQEICAQINRQLDYFLCEDNGYGFIVFRTRTKGSTSTFVIGSASDNAYSTLGISEGPYAGQNAASTNVKREGSFIWLADPMNFIQVILGQMRIYNDYYPRTDHFETVIYHENDYVIEEYEAIVKIINLKIDNDYL